MSEDFLPPPATNPEFSDQRLLLVGPMPPPLHGQTVVMAHMASTLHPVFPHMRIVNNSYRQATGPLGAMVKFRAAVEQFFSVRNCDVVYIAVKANHGTWITAAIAALARSAGYRIFLHHHSYLYVRERKPRMVALARAAGPNAVHIALTQSMADDLRRVTPEISRTVVVGNAALIDKSLLDLPVKADSAELVLGHMSDLTEAKGIGEVVDLAVKLKEAGVHARLILGGPIVSGVTREHLDRAERELGELFEYRGVLAGESKRRFYDDITHFVLPSREEAVPLVLYEAMAAGVVCAATRQGSVAEQLENTPCMLADSAESFVEEVFPTLSRMSVTAAASEKCKRAYIDALAQSQEQLELLVELLKG